ncbi:MAG: HupE/UreJ family protein [Caulobacteraceae bacterium]
MSRSRPTLSGRLAAAIGWGVLAVTAFGAGAWAHDARPLSVEVTEQGEDLYLARLRVPPTVAADDLPKIVWPVGCKVVSDRSGDGIAGSIETTLVACSGGLSGKTLKVQYPIYNPSLSTLFRLVGLDGKSISRVMPPDKPAFTVPRDPGLLEVAAGYLKLGVEHIWTGVDHLLFVAGLLILAGSKRRVLLAITGFTLAHSITLSLSALDIVRLPGPPVEAAIALSILFLAREIAWPSPHGIAARYPVLVSSSFGLLHGFGFAAALREAGLPQGEIAAGLLCFNLGVEAGQLAFIAVLLGLFAGLRQALALRDVAFGSLQGGLTRLAGYGLGVPAAFWFVQRLVLMAA